MRCTKYETWSLQVDPDVLDSQKRPLGLTSSERGAQRALQRMEFRTEVRGKVEGLDQRLASVEASLKRIEALLTGSPVASLPEATLRKRNTDERRGPGITQFEV